MRTPTWSTRRGHRRPELAHRHGHRRDARRRSGTPRRSASRAARAAGSARSARRAPPTSITARVVDRVVEVVGSTRRAEIDLELEVDLERLGARLLLGEHAVHAEHRQARDQDRAHSAPAWRRARTMRSSIVIATISRPTAPSSRFVKRSISERRVRALVDETRVEEVAGEHADEPVAELLVVEQHPLVRVRRAGARATRRSRAAGPPARRGGRAGRARTRSPPRRRRAGCAASRAAR